MIGQCNCIMCKPIDFLPKVADNQISTTTQHVTTQLLALSLRPHVVVGKSGSDTTCTKLHRRASKV